MKSVEKMTPNFINSEIIASTKFCSENWDRDIEDIIFLKFLHPMVYIDTVIYDSLDFERKKFDEVTNIDVYVDSY